MPNKLFNMFEPVSAKQWKQKIQFDLKGADYNKTLLTETAEGITIKPFYHSDTVTKKLKISDLPNVFTIAQSIFINRPETAGKLATDALKRGAEAIRFSATGTFDAAKLFNSIKNNPKFIFFNFDFLDVDFLKELSDQKPAYPIFFNIDPIGKLVKTGNWFFNEKEDYEILDKLITKQVSNRLPGVDARIYHNAGANTVQQITYALAHGTEYLAFLEQSIAKNTLSKAQAAAQVQQLPFHFGIGYHYFFEIAKLRAFRYLWKQILQAYGFDGNALIFAEPGLRNKTIFDANANMLRTTSETLSAILGGADVVANTAYDAVFHRKNEFGERISRNQLIIAKAESRIENATTAEGSYYIESLTYEMAEKALQIFKDIEKKGGFVKMLLNGIVQRKIKENAQKEQQAFDEGKLVLVGSNKYPNNIENIGKDDLELYPFLKKRSGKTLIEPLIPVRLAEKLEKERLKSDNR